MMRIKKISRVVCATAILAALSLAIASCATMGTDIADALRSGDYARAERPLKQLAENGDQGAQYNLGVIYLDGLTGRRDYTLAAHYFLLAAAQGHAQAQLAIGKLYEAGRGVALDPEEAIGWYKRAAHQGNPEAQFKLAQVYDDKLGRVRQRDLAVKWYRRAAEQGYSGAQQRLLVDVEPSFAPDDNARFAIARTANGNISRLALHDQRARDAKARLNALSDKSESERATERSRYEALEASITEARDSAWRTIPFTRAMPVLVADPLTLALLDLHIEVRRALGPNHHTYVSGLVADPGCAGDVVADRLIYTYGRTATRREPGPSGAPADVVALRDLAAQIACLSVRQLADLEEALTKGSARVIERMKTNRRGELIPAFVQLVAPMQLLIFDARKHRGERSLAWRWFYQYGPQLKAAVAQSGWGSDGLIYVWDRRQAALVRFPGCTPTAPTPNCVDLASFIDSLGDPGAVGLGDCALAGMLMFGRTQIDGQDRYTCPWASCGPSGAPEEESLEARRKEVNSLWPSFPPQNAPTSSNGNGPCLSNGGYAFQGSLPGASTCINDLFKRSDNPWDTYATCMTEGSGTNEPPQLFGQLPGVPMGNSCELSQSSAMDPFRGQIWDEDAGQYRMPGEREIPPVTTSGTTPTKEELDRQGRDKETRKERTEEQQQQEQTKQTQEEKKQEMKNNEEKDPNKQKGGAKMSCTEFGDCNESCTGLGAQIARAKHCTEDLLNSFTKALGRPDRRPAPMRKIDLVANYHPDDAPVDLSKADVCTAGATAGSRRAPMACGLILCPGTGLAAAAVGEACSCGQDSPAFNPQHSLCASIQCTEDQILTNDCMCTPIGAGPGAGTPGDSPIDIRNLPPGVPRG